MELSRKDTKSDSAAGNDGLLFMERTFSVSSTMADMYQNMRLSWLFRLFQEISIQHTITLGVDRSKTLDKGFLWVISRQSVTIHRMPVYDETFLLSTWPGKTLEILFPRYYQVKSLSPPHRPAGRTADSMTVGTAVPPGQDPDPVTDTDSVLAEGEAFWLLMDQKTRSFVFPQENGIMIPGSSRMPKEQPFPRPLRCPDNITLHPALIYTPRFSQLDLNGHIGNANYYDIIDDLLFEDHPLRMPHHIEAEYRSEIRPGKNVRILCGMASDKSCFYCEGYPASKDPQTESTGRHIPPAFRILLDYT